MVRPIWYNSGQPILPLGGGGVFASLLGNSGLGEEKKHVSQIQLSRFVLRPRGAHLDVQSDQRPDSFGRRVHLPGPAQKRRQPGEWIIRLSVQAVRRLVRGE